MADWLSPPDLVRPGEKHGQCPGSKFIDHVGSYESHGKLSVGALHVQDPDGGLAAADAAVTQLRLIGGVRPRLPEPEYEAARANIYMEYKEFAAWYPIQFRIRHGFDRGYSAPSPEQIKEAYERFNFSRCDFY